MTVFGRDLEERGEDRGKLDPVKKAVKLQNGVSVKRKSLEGIGERALILRLGPSYTIAEFNRRVNLRFCIDHHIAMAKKWRVKESE